MTSIRDGTDILLLSSRVSFVSLFDFAVAGQLEGPCDRTMAGCCLWHDGFLGWGNRVSGTFWVVFDPDDMDLGSTA